MLQSILVLVTRPQFGIVCRMVVQGHCGGHPKASRDISDANRWKKRKSGYALVINQSFLYTLLPRTTAYTYTSSRRRRHRVQVSVPTGNRQTPLINQSPQTGNRQKASRPWMYSGRSTSDDLGHNWISVIIVGDMVRERRATSEGELDMIRRAHSNPRWVYASPLWRQC